jgi:hypothetical protein
LVSSAQVVRRLVYAQTRETIFSPAWNLQSLTTKSNVHYGLSGHMTVAWVLLYSILQVTVNVCQDEYAGMVVARTTPPPPTVSSSSSSSSRSPPPPPKTCPQDAPCSMAFLAAPLGTHNNAKDLNNYLRQFTLSNTNSSWQAQDQLRDGGYQNKLGVVATAPNATLVLGLMHISQPVRVITFHTLKSYTSKFYGSQLSVVLEIFYHQQVIHTTSVKISGYHNQTTSVAEPYVLDLKEHYAPTGSSLRMRIQLQHGTTFQINALLFCSR